MDQISTIGRNNFTDDMTIKAEPADDFHIKSEEDHTGIVESSLPTVLTKIEYETDAASIESEITLGDFECIPASVSCTAQSQSTDNPTKESIKSECDDECEKSFLHTLTAHKQLHSSERPYYACDEYDMCGRAFTLKPILKSHFITHSDSKPFACDDGDQRFSRKVYLKSHKLTHYTGDKQFACDIRFHKKGDLKTHQGRHLGQKSFICHICRKAYAGKEGLALHMQWHKGERPFPCDQCSKAFSKQCLLDSLKLQHSGERPFQCDECDLGFTRKLYLQNHKLKHSGVRPFPCDLCSSRFTTRTLLNQHKGIHTKHSGIKITWKKPVGRPPIAPSKATNDVNVIEEPIADVKTETICDG